MKETLSEEVSGNGDDLSLKQSTGSVLVLFLPPFLCRSNLTVISACRGRRNSAVNEWAVSRAAFCPIPLMELRINYRLKHKQSFSS